METGDDLPSTTEDNTAVVRIDRGGPDGYETGRVIDDLATLGGLDDLERQSVLYNDGLPLEFDFRITFLPKVSGTYACGENAFPEDGRPLRMELQRISPPLGNFRAREEAGSCTIELAKDGTSYVGAFTATLLSSAGDDTIDVSGSFRFVGES